MGRYSYILSSKNDILTFFSEYIYKARMGAPLHQQMSTHRFQQEEYATIRRKIRQQNKYHRSFSDNEQGTLMVSRSTQSGGVNSSQISNTTDKAVKHKTCSELYTNLCERPKKWYQGSNVTDRYN
jgi:hypothetical protein